MPVFCLHIFRYQPCLSIHMYVASYVSLFLSEFLENAENQGKYLEPSVYQAKQHNWFFLFINFLQRIFFYKTHYRRTDSNQSGKYNLLLP